MVDVLYHLLSVPVLQLVLFKGLGNREVTLGGMRSKYNLNAASGRRSGGTPRESLRKVEHPESIRLLQELNFKSMHSTP